MYACILGLFSKRFFSIFFCSNNNYCQIKLIRGSFMIDFLSQEQVLEQEITLLNSSGPSLASFYTHDPDTPIFTSPPQYFRHNLQVNHKLTNTKSASNNANNSLYLVGLVILTAIKEQKDSHDLLQKLKLSLYDKKLNLKNINGYTRKQLTNEGMKKIIVQFLQIMAYFQGDLDNLLSKYSIVLQIFSLYFRVILTHSKVKDAQFYNKQLNHFLSTTQLLDFFDISYLIRKNIISIQNTTLCIFIDAKTNKPYIGERINDLSTKTSGLDLQIEDCDDCQVQMRRQIPIFMTPTPCFAEVTWDDPLKDEHSLNRSKPLGEVTQQICESGSTKKLDVPQQILQSNSAIKKQTQNFKNILQNFNKPNNLKLVEKEQFTKVQSNRQSKQVKDSGRDPRSSNGINDKMKISQFHYATLEEQYEKKSAKSERIRTNNRRQTQQNDEDREGHLSHYDTQRGRSYKLQSCVVQLKIEPSWQRRYKTNNIEQIKQKLQIKNPKNQTSRQGNRTFGKMPQFLMQKLRTSNRNSPMHIHMKTQQDKCKKPKVVFTYGTTQKTGVIQKKMIGQKTIGHQQGLETSRVKYHTQPSYMRPNTNVIQSTQVWRPVLNSPPGFIPAYTKNYIGRHFYGN